MENQQGSDETTKGVRVKIHDDKIVRRVVLIVITTIIILSTIGVFSVYSYVSKSLDPVDPDSSTKIAISIPLGSSSTQIATILEENKLITDSRIFKFYLKIKNEGNFQAGDYELSQSLTLAEIIKELQTGKIIHEANFTVTIPEGKNVLQIAEVFSHRLETFTSKEFVEKASDKDFIKKLIAKYPNVLSDKVLDKEILFPLEGYLFAGTYDVFEEKPTVEDIIDLMVARTNKEISKVFAEVEQTNFSVHEVLTFASVIERESKFKEDRPKVAQVFMNRIKDGKKFQSDVTAAYALQEHKVVMNYEDIGIDSPYNTYVVEGLPIGPINSPSLESINAVIEPEGEDFTAIYFYARPSGETHYTSTLDAHNKVKKQYEHEWHELKDAQE